MALWDKNDQKKEETGSYIAMLDNEGDMVAIINPMKNVPQELLIEALAAKGVNCELRVSKSDRVDLKL